MAGAGFKTFNTGDVLTASDVNTYLMQQTVMVFDDATARSTALPTPSEGMFSYLKDTNLSYRYDGSAWISDVGTTSPLTTKGDIWGYSTTDARIPVGANGTVLTADSSETLGVKWAAAGGGGGFVFITSSTFSNVASVTIDNCFNSTYDTYLVTFIDCYGGTAADDAQLEWRYSTSTLTSGYYSSHFYYNSGAVVGASQKNVALGTISDYIGSSSNKSQGQMFVSNAGSSGQIQARGQWANYNTETANNFGITIGTTETYTGLVFKSSSSNVYGTIRVYGLVKS